MRVLDRHEAEIERLAVGSSRSRRWNRGPARQLAPARGKYRLASPIRLQRHATDRRVGLAAPSAAPAKRRRHAERVAAEWTFTRYVRSNGEFARAYSTSCSRSTEISGTVAIGTTNLAARGVGEAVDDRPRANRDRHVGDRAVTASTPESRNRSSPVTISVQRLRGTCRPFVDARSHHGPASDSPPRIDERLTPGAIRRNRRAAARRRPRLADQRNALESNRRLSLVVHGDRDRHACHAARSSSRGAVASTVTPAASSSASRRARVRVGDSASARSPIAGVARHRLRAHIVERSASHTARCARR